MLKEKNNSIISVSNRLLSLNYFKDEELEIIPNLCPLSLTKGKFLFRETLANHILEKFWKLISEENFYFCDIIDCPIVYYNNIEQVFFGKDDVKRPVMHKMHIKTENRPICYCNNVLEKDLLYEVLVTKRVSSISDVKIFTKANTGGNCRITNPSGKCCGKQIKELLHWSKEQLISLNK